MNSGQIGRQGARVSDEVLRRKLAASRAQQNDGGPGADRSWRVALARAARDHLKLDLDATSSSLDRCSLAELLELPPDHALIAVLEGPAEGLGLLVLDAAVLAGMIEVLTLGKVGRTALVARKPTRTDAAMVARTLDAALCELDLSLAQEADLVWAGGFRYASFIEDPRPLGLLLEDVAYRVLRTDISLADGARSGQIILALPAAGRGAAPASINPAKTQEPHNGAAFSAALAVQVEAADCVLDAVISRVSLPLSRVLQLQVGEVIELPNSGIDRIYFEGIDGRRVGEGRLGQNRGLRAVRLSPVAANDTGARSVRSRNWSESSHPEAAQSRDSALAKSDAGARSDAGAKSEGAEPLRHTA